VTHVRLDVYPDGGLARLRINGEVDDAALRAAMVRWLDLLPESHAVTVLSSGGGLSAQEASALVGKRPFGDGAVPDDVVTALLDA
jgi:allantoicase